MGTEPVPVRDKMTRSERNDTRTEKTELEMEVSNVAKIKDIRRILGLAT